MRNERAICRADAMYFKTRYGYLCDEEGTVMRYVPRVSQIVFSQVLADFDEKQLAIEIQALKGHSLGYRPKYSSISVIALSCCPASTLFPLR